MNRFWIVGDKNLDSYINRYISPTAIAKNLIFFLSASSHNTVCVRCRLIIKDHLIKALYLFCAQSLQVHLSSTQGPIEVFLCSEEPIPMEATDDCLSKDSHFYPSTNRNGSAPFLPYSSFVQVSSKGESFFRRGGRISYPSFVHFALDLFFLAPCFLINNSLIFPDNAKPTSGINSISNPPLERTQHSSPATINNFPPMPTSLRTPSEDQQSFVTLAPPMAFSVDGKEYLLSLTEDEGITDLFSSVDLDQLPLDMPVWNANLEMQ